MTVESNDTIERTVIDGEGPYPFSFRIFNATDLAVTACSTDTPAVTLLLTYLTHYTVSGVNEADGGSISLSETVASTYDGYTLDIRSNTPSTQPTSIRNTARFSPEIHEDALDRLTREVQDLRRILNACIRYPDNVVMDGTLTPLSGWASRFLAFSSAGEIEPAALTDTTLTPSLMVSLLGGSPAQTSALNDLIQTESDFTKRTAAEIAAGVVPVNYAYSAEPILVGERYGFTGDNSTLNDTAMERAIDVCTQLGGGVLMLKKGIYRFAAGFVPPESMQIWGAGRLSTVLKCTGNVIFMNLTSANSSRCVIRDLTIEGTSQTGTGVQIGDTNHCGQHSFHNVRITSFNTGVRLAAALWTSFRDCLIDFNDNGVDYNAGSGSMYSNAISFKDCIIASNDRSGIAATSTPVRNIGLQFIGGSIESNGTESPAAYPQVVLGALSSFYFNFYGIESQAVTKPDGFDLSGASNGEIANVNFLGTGTAIKSGAGGCSHIFIHHCDFNSTQTRCINLPSCLKIVALHNEYDLTNNVIDGATSTDITDRLPNVVRGSYTGTLTGGVATNPTATIDYTMVDDVVTLHIPTLAAESNATTQPTITGMPAAIRPSGIRGCIGAASDNGVNVVSRFLVNLSGTIDVYNGVSATFTTSGAKGCGINSLTYKK